MKNIKELLDKQLNSTDNNLNFTVDSTKINLNPNAARIASKYYILVVDQKFSQQTLYNILLFYSNISDNERTIGLDFEFNTKVIALMQVCL